MQAISTHAGKRTLPAALLVLICGLLVFQNKAEAQVTYAAVHGTVTDVSGAIIPNASVSIVNTSTGITTKAKTDGSGYYIVPQLQIGGPYTVDIEAPGFENFESTGLILNLNDNRDVDAKLQVGVAAETVHVQAAAVQVETADTQLKQVVTAKQIEDAPLLGRDAVALQKLEPGNMDSSDRFGTYSANGSQTTDNSFLINGIDNNDFALQTEGIVVNPDALEEENIVSSTLNPEFSRNGGAIVNQTIKSGTNSFHGSGFELYRDTFLNNGSYFSPSRPPFHQNFYGGTFGGPLIKNKFFFFLAYQGQRAAVGQTSSTNVLSPAARSGDFTNDFNVVTGSNSAGLSSNPLPFPIQGCAPNATTWATCFPSGTVKILPGAWNPLAAKLFNQYVPASNFQATSASGTSYFYNFNTSDTRAQDQGIIRLDYHLSDRDSFWASTLFQSSPTADTLPFGGSTLPGFAMRNAEHYKLFSASYTHTFNSTTLNETARGVLPLELSHRQSDADRLSQLLRLRHQSPAFRVIAAVHVYRRIFQSGFQLRGAAAA